MWYLYTIEFHSATKKDEILSLAGKLMELENIILSEVIQAQKAKATCFLLHAEYRSSTNTCNIMKNRSCCGEVTYKRGNIKEGR
jgi:hypothetical protein